MSRNLVVIGNGMAVMKADYLNLKYKVDQSIGQRLSHPLPMILIKALRNIGLMRCLLCIRVIAAPRRVADAGKQICADFNKTPRPK